MAKRPPRNKPEKHALTHENQLRFHCPNSIFFTTYSGRIVQYLCFREHIASSVGTEELAHLEMVCTIVHQLTRGLSAEEIAAAGLDKYYVDHTLALWPQAAGGIPFNACEFQSKGDPITDLVEDLAAEQKARTTYDNILRLVKDPEVCDPIRFLRQREIVHFQRFGEGLRRVQEDLSPKNFYAYNPAFDK